jgi:putative hydrolase of the HAD superfamily
MSAICAISFDADGTLWDFEKVMRHSLAFAREDLLRATGLEPDALSIEAMIEIRNRTAEELRGRVTNLEAVRLEAFRRTLASVGYPDDALAERLNAVYLRHRFEDAELFDDVLPTLDALQGRFRLGIVSNGNSYPERCGLGGRFEFVVLSQDHGVEKPDPRLFEVALRLVGCAPGQLLHVGDSYASDVVGARLAGVRSVWLNRDGSEHAGGVQPDFEIRDLRELIGICEV